jgi:hypothetical protein
MTSRQAIHQAKRRSQGAVTINVTFRADEPEAEAWGRLSAYLGPKEAMKRLLVDAVSFVARHKTK